MASSREKDEIIAKASQWTSQDDKSLFLWMEAIAKNLEEHVVATNEKFNQLSLNFNNTSIAFDNVTNSLSALQYNHFVENRCLDDDETIANVAEVPIPKSNQNDEPEEMSREDFQQLFLRKNLDVMHNNYEKYPVNSEENNVATNFIYKPKNPYNQSPLPHVIGSNLWKEQWHIGLLEDSNSRSNNKIPKVFRDTFLSQATDESVIITSTSSLQSLPTTTLPKISRGIDANNDSPSNISTKPSAKQSDSGFDLFAPVNDALPPISPPVSSVAPPHPPPPPPPAYHQFGQSLPTTTHESPSEDTQPPTKSSSEIQSRPLKPSADANFNALLKEIVEKSNSKRKSASEANARSHAPEKRPDNTTITEKETVQPPVKVLFDETKAAKISEETIKPSLNLLNEAKASTSRKYKIKPALNLFDDSDDTYPAKTAEELPKVNEAASSKRSKPPTINLFDSSDLSPPKNYLFSAVDDDSRKRESQRSYKTRTKTIFDDDDDDDDDFFTLFASKKNNLVKAKPLSKTLIFDDDLDAENKDKNETTSVNIADGSRSKSVLKDADSEVIKKSSLAKIDLFGDLDEEDYIEHKQEVVKHEKVTNIEKGLPAIREVGPIDFITRKENVFYHDKESSIGHYKKGSGLFTSAKHDNKADIENVEEKTDEVLDDVISSIPRLNDSKLTELPQSCASLSQPLTDDLTFQANAKQTSSSSDVISSRIDHSEERPEDDKFTAASIANDEINKSKSNMSLLDSFQSSQLPHAAVESVKSNESEQSVKKSTSNKYTSLFLEDEPPEDDNAFFQALDSTATMKTMSHEMEQEIYESMKPAADSASASASRLYQNSVYGGVGLYSEVPPEDDDADNNFEPSIISSTNSQSSEPKRNIFYDDFDETMTAVTKRKMFERSKNVHAIFDDEPPLDDFQPLLQSAAKIENQNYVHFDGGGEEEKIKASQENLASSSSSQTVAETTKPSAVPEKSFEKPSQNKEISKLDISKININVKALLPTAVAPKSLQEVAQIKPTKEQIKTSQTESTDSTNVLDNTTPANLNENLLVNACKHRVRASAKRRPSTRQARRDNYKKTLILEQSDVMAAELEQETSKTEVVTAEPCEEILKPTANSNHEIQHGKNNFAGPEKSNFVKSDNTKHDSMCVEDFRIKESEAISFLGNSRTLTNKIIPPIQKSVGSLFDDSDEDESDLFCSHKNTKSNQIFYISNEVTATADVTHQTPSEADSKKNKNPNREINLNKSRSHSENKKSQFDRKNVFSKTTKSEAKKTISNLFDDDDDDDLFGGSLLNKAKNSILDSPKLSEHPIVPTTAVASTANKKLSKAEAVKQSNLFTSTMVKSLFESDEDEGDDGLGFLKNTQQRATQKLKSIQKASAKLVEKKVLFSDTDDDDDELFSSTSSKAGHSTVNANVVTSQTKKPTATIIKATQAPTTNPDNPLADLLNNC